jgi:hypothetical protein
MVVIDRRVAESVLVLVQGLIPFDEARLPFLRKVYQWTRGGAVPSENPVARLKQVVNPFARIFTHT